MTKRLAGSLLVIAVMLVARPAWAPFHLMVIHELFYGTETLPNAHYVQLRTLAMFQTLVHTQRITTQNADGSAAADFGAFGDDVSSNFDAGAAIIAGTQEAQDLFCVTMDQVVEGKLVFASGRACFAGAVDCVAYGEYTGSNPNRGQPAVTPKRGMALTRASQTNNNAQDFVLSPPAPMNNAGAEGQLDGTPGDPDGTGEVSVDDLGDEVAVLFEAGKRCDLSPERRGADANIDTRVNAADITATIQIALPRSAACETISCG